LIAGAAGAFRPLPDTGKGSEQPFDANAEISEAVVRDAKYIFCLSVGSAAIAVTRPRLIGLPGAAMKRFSHYRCE